MARPKKKGLEYFTNDVNFYQDIKIRKLIRHKGIQAVSIYHILLCQIYSQGYYLDWDDDLPFILNEISGLQEDLIQECIDYCVSVGLFDKTLFESEKVLTSQTIQERYIEIITAAKRKIDYNLPYLIVKDEVLAKKVCSEETTVNSEETIVNSEETIISTEETLDNSEFSTQSKVKESKVKKRKENNSLRSSFSKTSTPSPAHAREDVGFEEMDRDNDSPLTAVEGVEILKNDEDWLLQVQRKFALEKAMIMRWLDSFCVDCDCRGKQQHENLADVKQHFNDWLPKMLSSKGNKKTCKGEGAVPTPEQRWVRCQAELSKSVKDVVARQTFDSLKFNKFDPDTSVLLLSVPNRQSYEFVEENLIGSMIPVLHKHFGQNVKLRYQLSSN